jgi:Tat protein secretion system quality control protein TatD with DNase activity
VAAVAERVADLRGESLVVVAAQSTRNAINLFGPAFGSV